MKKMNKKGFTLVELLAVIVILAIILIIAVPGVLTIIDNSRKDSLVSTAKSLGDATRLFVTTSDDITSIPSGDSAYIPLKCIEADYSQNGFGKTINETESYMIAKKVGGSFEYYAGLYSGDGEMSVPTNINVQSLTRSNVAAWSGTKFSAVVFSTKAQLATGSDHTYKVDPDTCKLVIPTA